MVRNAIPVMAFTVTLAVLAGCGSSGQAATKTSTATTIDPPNGRGPNAGGVDTSEGGPGRGVPGRGPGGMGGRGNMSTVLGPGDVAAVKLGPIEASMAIQGDLKPIEETAVRARIEGNVEAVFVREGDRVTRGQVMARFENSTQESARKSSEADVASAKADLANAQWNADQSAQLFKAGAIAERDLRTAQTTLAASEARLAAAEARLRATTQDVLDTRVLAPTTGIVSTRAVESGEHVSRGSTVFTVVRNDVLELEAALPARFAADVRPAQTVHFNAGGEDLDGKVARVSPTINPASRSITVYLQVPNPKGTLKGNAFATGRIVSQSVPNAMIIPTAAIRYQQQQPKPLVYRIINDAIDYAPISLGIVDEVAGTAQVLDGLNVGDQIVVGNIGALGRGVKVIIARAPEQGRSRPVGGEASGGRQGGRNGGRGGRKGSDNPVPRPPQ